MTMITNMLKHRAAKVRDGKGAVVTIPPTESRNVEGFDAKRKFNAALLEAGDIRVGGSPSKKGESEERGAQLKADLGTAQTAFKQAKDELSAANKALKDDDSDANKKAKSVAVENYKKAEADLDAAEKAFAKG